MMSNGSILFTCLGSEFSPNNKYFRHSFSLNPGISGCTKFLAETELKHAKGILKDHFVANLAAEIAF